jgi:hypothetical protein
MVSNSKNALPSGDRVCANHRMDSLEFRAYILRGASWLAIKFETILFRSNLEAWLSIGSVQGLEKFLIWGRQPVIEFIA